MTSSCLAEDQLDIHPEAAWAEAVAAGGRAGGFGGLRQGLGYASPAVVVEPICGLI